MSFINKDYISIAKLPFSREMFSLASYVVLWFQWIVFDNIIENGDYFGFRKSFSVNTYEKYCLKKRKWKAFTLGKIFVEFFYEFLLFSQWNVV